MAAVFGRELTLEGLRFASPACHMENGGNVLREADFKGWALLERSGFTTLKNQAPSVLAEKHDAPTSC